MKTISICGNIFSHKNLASRIGENKRRNLFKGKFEDWISKSIFLTEKKSLVIEKTANKIKIITIYFAQAQMKYSKL